MGVRNGNAFNQIINVSDSECGILKISLKAPVTLFDYRIGIMYFTGRCFHFRVVEDEHGHLNPVESLPKRISVIIIFNTENQYFKLLYNPVHNTKYIKQFPKRKIPLIDNKKTAL